MIALVKHREVNRFTGIFHQLTQNRMDDRQQITALQEAAADDESMGAHRPVAQLTDLTNKTQLLHGRQQAVSRGVRQAGLLGQFGQRHAAVGFSNPFEQLQSAGQGLNLPAGRSGGGGGRFSAAFCGSGGRHRELLFSVSWK